MMSDKNNSNSTLIIFMLGGVVLAMCACILLGAFMFVGFNVTQPEVAFDPVVEPVVEIEVVPTISDDSTDNVAVENTAEPVDNTVVDSGTNTSVFDLREGTCFNDPVTQDEDLIEELSVVSCDAPHDNEVFALVDHPDGTDAAFPGQDAISEFANEQCEAVYYAYVGTAYADSLFLYSTYYPTAESWSNGDREVICFLYHPDLEKLTGSRKGSNE